MANPSKRLDGNVSGDFFVDATCIDCGACRWISPNVFGRDGEYAVVTAQPTPERLSCALTAVVACPVGAIGAGPNHASKKTAAAQPAIFPGSDPADGVHHVGLHSKKSFGATSWFIVRPGGNVLVDSPRITPALLKRLTALGGVDYLFLSHRDDVAEHARLAAHFGLTRILHRQDVCADTAGVEMPIDGTDPIPLGDDLLILPTPGHTAGSTCLLYKNRYLFSGDHLAFGPGGEKPGTAKHRRERFECKADGAEDPRHIKSIGEGLSTTQRSNRTAQQVFSGARLIAFDRHCWHHWPTQIASMERLKAQRFEWVLPGHGAPGHLTAAHMPGAMDTLIDWMRQR